MKFGQDSQKIVDLATEGRGDESLNGFGRWESSVHLVAVKTIFWQRTCVVNMSYMSAEVYVDVVKPLFLLPKASSSAPAFLFQHWTSWKQEVVVLQKLQ